MTTINPARPALSPPPRPAASPAAAGGIGTQIIDPVKLLQKYKWLLAVTAAVGIGIGLVAHVLLLRLYPIYTTMVVYECYPVEVEAGSIGGSMNQRDEMESFKATQVQNMISDRTIDRAVNDPRLVHEAPKWSRQFMTGSSIDTVKAATKLRKQLSAGSLGDSNLIRLSFWWTDPDEAVAVAKIVGRNYLQDRTSIAESDTNQRKDTLSAQIRLADDRIKVRQADRERILQDQNVDALEAAKSSANQKMQTINLQLTGIRLDIENLQSMKAEMDRELASPVGINYSDTIRKRVEEDPIILNQKHQINMLESELDAMRQRLGPQHRDRVRYEMLLNSKRLVLDETRERLLRQAFDAQYDSLRIGIASAQAQQDDQLKELTLARAEANQLTQTLSQVDDINSEINRLHETKARFDEALKNIVVVTGGKNLARVSLYQDAQRPRSVTFPKLFLMVPAGLFLALGIVGGLVLLVELIDQRVKGPACIAMIPRTRVLGLIAHAAEDPANPAKVETVFRDQPGGVLAEHFRALRGQILKRMQQGGHKSLVVMAGMPDSGATTVVTNLALAMAAAEQRVLVIDANFRRPALHKILGLPESPGLADVLAGSRTMADCTQATDNDRLSILSAGSADNRMFERLGADAMGELLKEAAAHYDIVLIDVAPAMVSGDAIAVANKADASLLVVRAMGEKRGMVARLRNDLGDSRAEFLGVLVNAARSAAGGYLKGNILATHKYRSQEGK